MSSSSASRAARIGAVLPALAALLLGSGCVEHALIESIQPTEYPIADPVVAPPASEGAIWRGTLASGSFLAYDRKARGLGDLVTVVLLESLAASGSANTDLEKASGFSADLTSDIGFTGLLQKGAKWFFNLFDVDGGGNAPDGTTVNAVESNQGSQFSGDGQTARESRMRGVVTCRVVRVLPGGLLHVYGRRRILVNHELQLVTVDGLVRRTDIGIDNSVPSTQLADVKLTFDGIGVIDDKQRPSLLARMLDWVYPF